MRKRLGSLLLAVSLSMSMVVTPFYESGISIAKADENKLKSAEIQSDGTIVIRTVDPFPSETDLTALTTITDADGNKIAVTSASINGRKGLVTPAEDLVFGNDYTVAIEGLESIAVNITALFGSEKFDELYKYDGDDLGATWTAEKTTFKVWAPTASSVKLNLYTDGEKGVGTPTETLDLVAGEKGTWSVEKTGDLHGTYYTYSVTVDGSERETCDPYAKAVGVNGDRAMVIDLSKTDPEGWDKDQRQTVKNITDAIIYELHVRDFSAAPDAGFPAEHVGKYLAFTDKGTKTPNGVSTGIDHIVELGANMVHILPSYDFATVPEKESKGYNWGYDPKNYQVPEGSYSTNPADGAVRIKEYKQMVQALHNEGIGVIQDCVYNHTSTLAFCYNYLVPGYYHRSGSNGSGCGNDVASERSMVRKYIVDSVKYWAEEFHLDGYRFDLMGLHDVETMMQVREALNKIDPSIIIYGEGWTMGTNVSSDVLLATQKNCSATEGIAYFSDGIRDAVVNASFGSGGLKPGYANGSEAISVESMKKYVEARYTSNAQDEAKAPTQVVNYVTCHDGFTLWDKINKSNPDDSEEDKIKQALLSEAIIFTSQGVPFLLSGDEFLRIKHKADGTVDHNSYMSGDEVNALQYSQKEKYPQVFEYLKGLIEFRKAHAGLRYTTFEEIDANLSWIDGLDKQVMAFTIKGGANGEVSDNLMVVYNPTSADTKVTLPAGEWKVCVNGEKAGTEVLETVSGELTVSPISCYALVQGETQPKEEATTTPSTSTTPSSSSSSNSDDKGGFPWGIVVVVGAIVGIVVFTKKKN